MKRIDISDIKGIKIGNAQNFEARTGCTVVICENGATCGVDVRGGAPGTRETDLLNPVNLVDKVHAVVLSGGSAFGLDASCGVMQFLEERNIGFDVGVTKVPIVCSAVLFDLMVGDYRIRPDRKMGYEACINAFEVNRIENGKFGAGTGATVGKILGPEFAMEGGLGSYAVSVGDLKVGAVVAVNCLGDVIDPKTGKILAGALNEDKTGFIDSTKVMLSRYSDKTNFFSGNTTIAAVVTNAKLTKAEATKVSSMAHDAFARTMRPAHTMFDGDTIFTMATGEVEIDISTLGMIATTVLEEAILSAISHITYEK
ncbi:MAG: peptidase DmpA [Caloramator sp.]|uniref:P1 family peptidase n=1 Tax=Caloramator sp. TaxID=1871330 RepID=UPI001D9F3223|nr:P1 family peptidase [Caloramator sp.]MBZ4663754.1 peptidase DmpA [Caloramator sp.]